MQVQCACQPRSVLRVYPWLCCSAVDSTALRGPPVPPKPSSADGPRLQALGGKDIGPFLSIIFIVNQIYGPGLLAIPIVMQQAGWLPTLGALGFFLCVSCFSSTLLCEAISCIPGNERFQRRVEFTTAVKYFYGRRWHTVFQARGAGCAVANRRLPLSNGARYRYRSSSTPPCKRTTSPLS
jgi:hypothetical protein